MVYKLNGNGWMTPPAKISRGPWFKEQALADDDGLEKFYYFEGPALSPDSKYSTETRFLLSNNLPFRDRDAFKKLYESYKYRSKINMVIALALSAHFHMQVPYLRKLAVGWRFLTFLGGTLTGKICLEMASSKYRGDSLSAYLKLYYRHTRNELWKIQDEKREWFEIDTSYYMNYDYEDVKKMGKGHVNYSARPVCLIFCFLLIF